MMSEYKTRFFFKAAALKAYGLQLLSVEKDVTGSIVFVFKDDPVILRRYDQGEGAVSPISVVNALSELKILMRQAACS